MMLRAVRITTLVGLWLVPLLIMVIAFNSSWVQTWKVFHVPSMTPRFLDLCSIPTGIETWHKGGDPLVANPADPIGRPMNYPRLWLYLFSAARIDAGKVATVGVILCAFYLACISYLIVQSRHALDAVVLLAASLSVGPLLAIERGNTDLLIFSLVFLACAVTNRFLKSALFGIAALLKIFPLAGMMVDAIRRPGKGRLLAAGLTGLVLVAILLQWHDLSLIRAATPVSKDKAYGVLSLEQELLFATLRWGFLIGLGWIVVLECWLVGALAIWKAWQNPWDFVSNSSNSKAAEMFAIFGGIYAFTYAVGANYDYRLIFLVPTLPFVLQMGRSNHRVWAILYVAMLGLAENAMAFEDYGGTIAGHAASFLLFLMILAMLTRLLLGSKEAGLWILQPVDHLSRAVDAQQTVHMLD
jgi:hypothetical protein